MDRDEILRVFRAFEESGLEYVLSRTRPRSPLRAPARSDFDRFLGHCARYWKIAPKVYPRGVFKFRSITEARHPDR